MSLSIAEIIVSFQNEAMAPDACLAALEVHSKTAKKQQEKLSNAQVPPQDKSQWDDVLKPGLSTCYEGLIGASEEAQAFIKTGKDNLLEGIFSLLTQVDHIMNFLKQQTGLSSQTEALVQEGLSGDGFKSDTAVKHGTAESTVSFISD